MAVSAMDKVKGAFNLVFFFGRGIKPFEADDTRAAALKSLWITAALYPLAVVASWLHPAKGLEHLGRTDLFIITTAEYVGSIFLCNGAAWLFAYALRVEKRFWLFFQASNWTGIPSTILSAPFLALAMFHTGIDATHMNRILTLVAIYFAMASSCVAFRAFKINWELSVFIATLMMLCEQIIENTMFRLYHIPIDWVG